MKLNVATCQFPVSGQLTDDLRYILDLMSDAADAGAEAVHFGECALGGYAGADIESYDRYDWQLDRQCKQEILRHANRLGVWAIVGGVHQLEPEFPPHNSVWVIDGQGQCVDRYDKVIRPRLNPAELRTASGDARHFSSGTGTIQFTINDICCSVLICSDFRLPQLYMNIKRNHHAQLVFHSFHNGGFTSERMAETGNPWGDVVPAMLQSYGAVYDVWISASNTSRQESCWGAFWVTPDGRIQESMPRNESGFILNTVDTDTSFYRSPAWNEESSSELYNNPYVRNSQRSKNRTEL